MDDSDDVRSINSSSLPHMLKNYNAQEIEEKWYKFWLDNKIFHSEPDSSKKPFTIILPPPNSNASCHMGHALNVTLQDIMIRYKKMQGFNTLWIPGTDHGGISTQYVVEKYLLSKNIKRQDMSKEEFINLTHEKIKDSHDIIMNQFKKIGCSCDWEREQYTMNESMSETVQNVFISLYEKGLIYRGNYITNWCQKCQTVLSDDELNRKNYNGKLYYLKYKIHNTDKYLLVATTRPETIFGDVAVAYNPKDERYHEYKNIKLVVPYTNKVIDFIADESIDINFGTGLCKITPAHDKNDYLISSRHKLEKVMIISKNGMIYNTNTEFDNIPINDAKRKLIKKLHEMGLIESEKHHEISLNTCYRCGTNIESILSDQWFIKMQPLLKPVLDMINNNEIKLVPEYHKKIIESWINENIDWCISRQIWWGHEIPMWLCSMCNKYTCGKIIKTCSFCKADNTKLVKDPDVLDTWFSSALWPFAVFTKPADLDYYFPTSLLITGSDILFFWVVRMIMMSNEVMKKKPFDRIYLHGLVRDGKGSKMSKSVGNVIDPLEIINKYSSDILRFTLAMTTPFGQDVKISDRSFEKTGKIFCTKLWNSVRYVLMNIHTPFSVNDYVIKYKSTKLSHSDKWILHKLKETITNMTNALEELDTAKSTGIIYDFMWNNFCNTYLEIAKTNIKNKTTRCVLLIILDNMLKLLHPIIPFLTEELWQMLKNINTDNTDKSILLTKWPDAFILAPMYNYSGRENELFNTYLNIIKRIRALQLEYKDKTIIEIILSSDNEETSDYVSDFIELIKKFTKCNNIYVNTNVTSDHSIVEVNDVKIAYKIQVIKLEKADSRNIVLENILEKPEQVREIKMKRSLSRRKSILDTMKEELANIPKMFL